MALQKETVSAIIQNFKINEHDTGSAEVQIALLTHNINHLNAHCMQHRKDFSTQRGLLRMVSQRRKLLAYLKKTKPEQYKKTIEALGLRK